MIPRKYEPLKNVTTFKGLLISTLHTSLRIPIYLSRLYVFAFDGLMVMA